MITIHSITTVCITITSQCLKYFLKCPTETSGQTIFDQQVVDFVHEKHLTNQHCTHLWLMRYRSKQGCGSIEPTSGHFDTCIFSSLLLIYFVYSLVSIYQTFTRIMSCMTGCFHTTGSNLLCHDCF